MPSSKLTDAYRVATNHRLLMRLAAGRFALGGALFSFFDLGIFAYLPIVGSLLLGAAMAYYGYHCCLDVYDQTLAILAAAFLFAPGCWLLAILIINGNIGDALYKDAGSVGFFGVTEDQLSALRQEPSEQNSAT